MTMDNEIGKTGDAGQDRHDSAERFYKAFISYRHKPLDIWTAKRLHQRIEHFTVPENLRKDGQKHPGLVFRDQDELPIANNLSENICTALDHSEFLIVICTPDTPGSVWVNKEIEYFLEHHSRDKVLAVLAAGTPEESFPDLLTTVRDEENAVIEEVEPLAANIAADSERMRKKLLRTESLRILAALLGCPYDDLYHREQRYRRRRIAAAAAIAGVVAIAFIGLLLNRNARIRDQLLQTKITESRALAALSESSFKAGDYRGALSQALEALPGRDPGRPYVPAAEHALSSAMYLYQSKSLRYIQSFDQGSNIAKVELSADGKYLATLDSYDQVYVYDIASGTCLGGRAYHESVRLLKFVDHGLLVSTAFGSEYFEPESGNTVWSSDRFSTNAVQPQKDLCVGNDNDGDNHLVYVADIKKAEVLYSASFARGSSYESIQAAALSPSGNYAAFLLADYYEEPSSKPRGARLLVWDCRTGDIHILKDNLPYAWDYTYYKLCFGNDDTLAAACSCAALEPEDLENWEGPSVMMFDGKKDWKLRFHSKVSFGSSSHRAYTSLFELDDFGNVDYLDVSDSEVTVAGRKRVICLNSETGKQLWQSDLSGRTLTAAHTDKGSLFLTLSDGILEPCIKGNLGSESSSVTYFETGYDLVTAAVAGDMRDSLTIAVVSSENPSRVSVISSYEDPSLETLPGAEDVEFAEDLITSPSGNLIALIGSEKGDKGTKAILIDPSGKTEAKSYDLTYSRYNDRFWTNDYREDKRFLTDDGVLILNGTVFDLEKGTVTELIQNDETLQSRIDNSSSCKDPSDGCVLTGAADWDPEKNAHALHLYKDGVLSETAVIPYTGSKPEDLLMCYCESVSPQGNALLNLTTYSSSGFRYDGRMIYDSAQDQWHEAAFLGTDDTVPALGNVKPWVAVPDSDNKLRIYDFSKLEEFSAEDAAAAAGDAEDGMYEENAEDGQNTGDTDAAAPEPVLTADLAVPGKSVSKMVFFRDDTLLAVFCFSGDLLVYDTKDGKLISDVTGSSEKYLFSGGDRYEILEPEGTDRTLFFFKSANYEDPVCIAADRKSFQISGLYKEVSAFLPDQGKICTNPYYGTVRTCKLLSVEEIQEKAEAILGQ